MKAFLYNVDSSLSKSWSPGAGRGNNRESVYIEEKNCFPVPANQFQSNFVQIILGVKEIQNWLNKELSLFQRVSAKISGII